MKKVTFEDLQKIQEPYWNEDKSEKEESAKDLISEVKNFITHVVNYYLNKPKGSYAAYLRTWDQQPPKCAWEPTWEGNDALILKANTDSNLQVIGTLEMWDSIEYYIQYYKL